MEMWAKWAHERWGRRFRWQTGYAAFSVSPSKLGSVRNYIARQEEHHPRMTYQEEVWALAAMRQHTSFQHDTSFFVGRDTSVSAPNRQSNCHQNCHRDLLC